MSTVRVTEAELALDIHAVLVKVQEGVEVVIEQNQRPIAVIKPPKTAGRIISEVLADLNAPGSIAVMDDDFAHDIEASRLTSTLGHLALAQRPRSWDNYNRAGAKARVEAPAKVCTARNLRSLYQIRLEKKHSHLPDCHFPHWPVSGSLRPRLFLSFFINTVASS
ncbi:MAG: hypothetical protein Q8N47_02920 [Bryobacterales bacterium]|nr:hypothetical protein [Bryobacterales bacterium]